MAKADTPIPFTIGDQERLVRIEKGLEIVTKLPCVSDAPCPEDDRIKALEQSRNRGLVGLATFIVGACLYGLKLFIEFIGGQ